MASQVTMMPRARSNASTSRELRQKRKSNQTPWLILSAGKRSFLSRLIARGLMPQVSHTSREPDKPLNKLTIPYAYLQQAILACNCWRTH